MPPLQDDPRRLIQAAMQLHRRGDLAQAKALYGRALELAPQDPDALHLLGLIHHQQGAYKEAVEYIRRAVELIPGQPVLHNNLGDALRRAGEPQAAIEHLHRALELRPNYGGAHMNLAAAYGQIPEYEKALHHAQEAVRLTPEMAEARYNLGLALLDQLRLEDAAAAFRQALTQRPDYPTAAGNLLYLLNLIPGLDPQQVAAEHRRLCSRFDPAAHPPRRELPAPSERPLHIGYVSRDLRAHAVNDFLEPVLTHHDRQRFRIYCYSVVERPDSVTDRLRKLGHRWRDSVDWSDQRLDRQVRKDRIDILVDLAGHTEKNRLGLFAGKPAPLQISWLGYPNTTGLSAMDYRIVDPVTAPLGEPFPGTEAPLRLPQLFACFQPPKHAPEVSPLPATAVGRVTFGSLHKLEKLNHRVIAWWSRLLRANPDTQLLIARDQIDPWHQQWLEQAFAAHGIPVERLLLRHLDDPSRTFFEIFREMDILLDVFPWSGHTLACCALWMGVPVVTLRGQTHAGRMVAGVLESLGLDHLIANDEAGYLRIAGKLAADIPGLAVLRAGLRERVAASPLRDEAGFTRALEAAYRRVWDEFVRQEARNTNAVAYK